MKNNHLKNLVKRLRPNTLENYVRDMRSNRVNSNNYKRTHKPEAEK